MNENFAIQLFEGKKVRIVWDAEQEKYYFSVADIVQVLTDSADVKQYIKRMRARDSELNSKWGTICTPVEMLAPDGKRRKTQAADLDGIFRIIQAIPSKKAEPTKAYQINYMEALRKKAFKAGGKVIVTDIRPGLVNTALAKGEGLFWVMPVEKVASQICAAIRKRKSKVYVTKRWHVLAIINKNLPFTLYKRM